MKRIFKRWKRWFGYWSRFTETSSDRIGVVVNDGVVSVWFADLGRGIDLPVEDVQELCHRLLLLEERHILNPRSSLMILKG